MPSQFHPTFGYGPPLQWAARAQMPDRFLVKTVATQNTSSIYAGSIVRDGDYVNVEATSEPGNYQTKCSADGILDVVAAGDTRRQLVHAELYSRRLQEWTGDSNQYINNKAPVGTFTTLSLVVGVPMPLLDVLTLFTDAEQDQLTVLGITGAMIPDVNNVDGVIYGTPNTPGTGTFQVTVADVADDLGTSQVTWTVTQTADTTHAGSLTERLRVKTNVNGALTGG